MKTLAKMALTMNDETVELIVQVRGEGTNDIQFLVFVKNGCLPDGEDFRGFDNRIDAMNEFTSIAAEIIENSEI